MIHSLRANSYLLGALQSIVMFSLHVNDELLRIFLQKLGQACNILDRHYASDLLLLEVVQVQIGNNHIPVLLDVILVPFRDFTRVYDGLSVSYNTIKTFPSVSLIKRKNKKESKSKA